MGVKQDHVDRGRYVEVGPEDKPFVREDATPLVGTYVVRLGVLVA